MRAEERYSAAKAALEEAKRDREALRGRLADNVPVGEEVEGAGYRVTRSVRNSGEKFRLVAFLEKHPLPAKMRPFVVPGTEYEVWSVKEIADSAKRSRGGRGATA